METRHVRVKLSEVDGYVATQENFGWTLVGKDDLRPNYTIVLIMERDRDMIQDYHGVRVLEKQYYRLKKLFPLAFLINAIIGGGFLIAYFVSKPFFPFYYTFMYGALTFFGIAVFAFIVFFFLLLKRKKLMNIILKQASFKAGSNKDWPVRRNVAPENANTWALSKYTNG